jgi:aryl-alcohol dehydrogenase-like predicted oxidoreductase
MDALRLGRTDIEVTPIGLGAWQFAQGIGMGGSFWPSIDDDAITAVVRAARDGGISWFDTAEAYGRGRSERMLAAALSRVGAAPGSVVVATKWWPFPRTALSIGRTIESRIACLAPYPVDLFQVHQPWSLSSIRAQMRAFAALVHAKKIRAAGVSNFSARQMEQAHAALAAPGIPLASNQVRFNLLDRRIEANGVLVSARRLGVTIIAWSPLAQGMLTGRFHDDPALAARLAPGRRFLNGITPAHRDPRAGRRRARHLCRAGGPRLDRTIPRRRCRRHPRGLEAAAGKRGGGGDAREAVAEGAGGHRRGVVALRGRRLRPPVSTARRSRSSAAATRRARGARRRTPRPGLP